MNKTILSTAIAVAAGVSLSQAAVITWESQIVNTTAADIITAGTLHSAVDAASSNDNTINGVLFTAGNPLASNAEGTFWSNSDGGTFTTGDAGLDDLLDSHSYAGGTPSSATFDITGLIVGQDYDIQIIAVGDTRGCCATRTQSFGGDGAFSEDLTRFDPSSVVGHFTADATTQTITVNGSQDGGLSGYQVRLIPEPSGLVLLGLAGLVALRRRR